MKRFGGVTLIFTFLSILAIAFTSYSCPDFVKKDVVSLGDMEGLPDGWFVYEREQEKGLYLSHIGSKQSAVVPNTGEDTPIGSDITEDGQWVVYLKAETGEVFMIRPDGTGKVQVPTPDCKSTFPRGCGVYRNSPYGTEIYYLSAWEELRATQVDLSGDEPSFGDSRRVALLSSGTDYRFKDYGFMTEISVSANHIFSIYSEYPDEKISGILFLTIPDEGRGVAQWEDRWKFNHDPVMIWGCGNTLSPDGSKALWNAGAQGGYRSDMEGCIPSKSSGFDHKGFIVASFMEPDSPSVSKDEIIDDKALSVNWAPKQYRYGEWDEIDFQSWYWTNRDEYIVGEFQGELAENPGVWLVNWKTNTWTHLTDNIYAHGPALYFTDGVDARLDGNSGMNIRKAMRSEKLSGRGGLYDFRGRKIIGKNPRFRSKPGIVRGVFLMKSNTGIHKTIVAE